ncbi:2-methylaconitate cis-trans isomerase PrpF family protein [Streptomyces sp. NPDC059134]|uniref:2-methylaconitate cis-trans isomerase PrpF family protein n=1 Tax=Streptomyces sp. NPDC059134 TaxID=3346738 RepID=UPI0036A820A4
MSQRWIPATFIRGGTSKGVFFHERDLPHDPAEREPLFLDALGSPDPYGRQLNGLGGGLSSVSKAVIIGPPTRPDADVDYTFVAVAVDRPTVDYSANCGNLASAVGPFTVDEGICPRPDGSALVRIHNTNTNKIIHSRFQVTDGVADTVGDLEIPGVPGTGAPIELAFLDPGGSRTGQLLPTTRVLDKLDIPHGPVTVSLLDAANPAVCVTAQDIGLSGTESPEQIEAIPGIMERLDVIRRHAAVAMGLATDTDTAPLSVPKVAILSPPKTYTALDGRTIPAEAADISVRMVSMERIHRAVTVTGALGVAIGCRLTGTIPHHLARHQPDGTPLRVATPSGVLTVAAQVTRDPDQDSWEAHSASLYRTARPLMRGSVAVR